LQEINKIDYFEIFSHKDLSKRKKSVTMFAIGLHAFKPITPFGLQTAGRLGE
jgi:hypothetical protein